MKHTTTNQVLIQKLSDIVYDKFQDPVQTDYHIPDAIVQITSVINSDVRNTDICPTPQEALVNKIAEINQQVNYGGIGRISVPTANRLILEAVEQYSIPTVDEPEVEDLPDFLYTTLHGRIEIKPLYSGSCSADWTAWKLRNNVK